MKSRGPRTQAGKEQPRRNDLKHGMTAETLEVIPGEDQALLDDRIDAWLQNLGARYEVEGAMIRRAAILSWKLDRADRHESAVLTRKIHQQIELDRVRDYERLPKLIARLLPNIIEIEQEGFDPVPAAQLIREIESTSEGCHCLIRCWRHLEFAAKMQNRWTDWHEIAISRLTEHGLSPIDDPATLDLIVAGRLLMQDQTSPVDADSWTFGLCHLRLDWAALREACGRQPRNREEAYQFLRAAINRKLDRLEIVLKLRERDGHDQRVEESAAVVSFDTSVEGERLRRYQTTTLRDMNRTLEVVSKLRSQAQQFEKEEGRLDVARTLPREGESTPVVLRNEPNPATKDSVAEEVTEAVVKAAADTSRPILRNEPNFEVQGVDRIEIPTPGQGADRPPMPLRVVS